MKNNFFLILIIYSFTNPVFAKSTLIKSANIVNVKDGSVSENMDIELVNGKITKIGKNLKSNIKSSLINAEGMFVIPGIIDSHTHLNSIPGSVFRKDSPAESLRLRNLQLRSFLASGVTTVLDAAAPKTLLKQIGNNIYAPRVKILAPFLTPKDGYFGSNEERAGLYKDLWPAVNSFEEISKYIAQGSQMDSTGVKVTFEKGFGPFDVWPLFTDKQRSKIYTEAKKQNLPIYVHSMTEEEHREALTIKPYAMVHAGFNTAVASDQIIAEIKDSRAYVITTLTISKLSLLMWEPDELNSEWFKLIVPPELLKTALDHKIRDQVVETVVTQSKPKWIPTFAAAWLKSFFFNPRVLEKSLNMSMKSVKKMYEAGVPLVMGSDSGNWPVWTSYFHGVSSIIEMELLAKAGIPESEILKASTIRAAEMLKLDSVLGSIEINKNADLIILKKNPLSNISALRDLSYVIKNGHSLKPQEWMTDK